MAWVINKFSKKFIRPNYVPNNELLDFLSRVPDNEELADAKELLLDDKVTSELARQASSPGKKFGGKKKK